MSLILYQDQATINFAEERREKEDESVIDTVAAVRYEDRELQEHQMGRLIQGSLDRW